MTRSSRPTGPRSARRPARVGRERLAGSSGRGSGRDIDGSLSGFLRATYAASLKSPVSDEWINTYCIRPVASVLVWLFYRLGLRPVGVVLLGAVAGTLSGLCLAFNPWGRGLLLGGLLLILKNLLDAADGQLARATGSVDRIGRFADSIADFWVNGWITLGAAVPAASVIGLPRAAALAGAAFLLILLQCSLFVFYQVSFLARIGRSPVNRTDETPLGDDLSGARLERRLQRIYLALYGWQDRWMAALDRLLLRAWGIRFLGAADPDRGTAIAVSAGADRLRLIERRWYGDSVALRLTSFLGLGTSLTLYAVFLAAGRPIDALLWIDLGESSIAIAAILYRFCFLAPRMRRSSVHDR